MHLPQYKIAVVAVLNAGKVNSITLCVDPHSLHCHAAATLSLNSLSLQGNMRGFEMGGFHLDASAGRPTEACLTLAATTRAGSPVFDNLSNIRFTLETPKGPSNTREAQAPATTDLKRSALPTKTAVLGAHKAQKVQKRSNEAKSDSAGTEQPGSLYAYDWVTFDSEFEAEEEAMHPFLGATPGMKRAQRDAYAAAAARRAKEGLRLMGNEAGPGRNSSAVHAQADWQQLRREYLWPDGQGVMESLFTPYESEGIYTCMKCQPNV